jgi:hypothetical protein
MRPQRMTSSLEAGPGWPADWSTILFLGRRSDERGDAAVTGQGLLRLASWIWVMASRGVQIVAAPGELQVVVDIAGSFRGVMPLMW